MEKVKALKTTQTMVVFAIITFLASFPGMAFGEEAFLAEYDEIKPALSCEECPGIMNGDIIGINQDTCTPGPLICLGCYEYICMGLDGYATLTSEACFLLAFCFGASDCEALCIGLLPQISF